MPLAVHLRRDHQMAAARRRAGSAAILALVIMVASACGGGSGDAQPNPGAAATKREGPATITVKSSPIVGQQGRILLVSAALETAGPVAGACIRITSDRFTVPATVMTPTAAGTDPCSGASAPATVTAGSYNIAAGIYAPPGKTPEKEFTTRVESTGKAPVELTIDGSALSR